MMRERASGAASEAELVEAAHRALHALGLERQRLQRTPDAAAIAEADRIAIEYWRGVIADKLRRVEGRPG